MRLIDLTGQRFTRLTVVERAPNNGKQPAWLCRCDCGEMTTVQGGNLRDGNVQSCGCLRRPHGHSWDRGEPSGAYVSWKAMIQRTTNPKRRGYENYGGRGIRVCERWLTFENFLADMGDRPDGKSLDRIDPDGNYELANCRWATRSEQQRNQRRNRDRWALSPRAVLDYEQRVAADQPYEDAVSIDDLARDFGR